MGLPSPPWVLDACSLLNLVASRRLVDIATNTTARFLTSELAAREVRYVRRGGGGPDAREREEVDLQTFQRNGLLTVLALETPSEVATFVDLALDLDDGEAASGALAVCRGGVFVTDDRKARRVFEERYPAVRLLSTSEVIKAWADRVGLDTLGLALVLRDVEERARFRPGRHDPLCAWWESIRSNR